MKGREARHPRQYIQRQVVLQVFTDVVNDGVDALEV
jgi:hypothetical protein